VAARFLFSLILIGIALFITASVFFKVRHIVVEGSTMYSSASIVEASGLREDGNLFFIPKSAAVRAVFGQFPYVEKVRLRRHFPDTIIIEITERASVGLVPLESVFWVIDGEGKLLEKLTSPEAVAKPLVKGLTLLAPQLGEDMAVPQSEKDKLKPALALLLALYLRGDTVSQIDVSRMDRVTMECAGNIHVVLGDAIDMDIKLAFMEESLNKLPPGAQGTLDISRAAEKIASFQPASVESPPEEIPPDEAVTEEEPADEKTVLP
jgi:cell division protein FtsQ